MNKTEKDKLVGTKARTGGGGKKGKKLTFSRGRTGRGGGREREAKGGVRSIRRSHLLAFSLKEIHRVGGVVGEGG